MLRSIFILITALLATAPLAELGAQVKTQVEPLAWPAKPRPNLKLVERTELDDGLEVSKFYVSAFSSVFELANDHRLKLAKETGPRYSVLLTDMYLKKIKFGISVFEANEFLPDLNRKNWERYLIHLKTAKPNVNFISEMTNIDVREGVFLLGKKYRQVVYEMESPAIYRREFFTFIEGRLFVFTVMGSRGNHERDWARFSSYVNQMNVRKRS